MFDGIPGSEFGLNEDIDDDEPLGVIVGFVLIGTINVSAARFGSEIILIFSLIPVGVWGPVDSSYVSHPNSGKGNTAYGIRLSLYLLAFRFCFQEFANTL